MPSQPHQHQHQHSEFYQHQLKSWEYTLKNTSHSKVKKVARLCGIIIACKNLLEKNSNYNLPIGNGFIKLTKEELESIGFTRLCTPTERYFKTALNVRIALLIGALVSMALLGLMVFFDVSGMILQYEYLLSVAVTLLLLALAPWPSSPSLEDYMMWLDSEDVRVMPQSQDETVYYVKRYVLAKIIEEAQSEITSILGIPYVGNVK